MTARIAILGAGPSGLAQLRAFETARRGGAEMPQIDCYASLQSDERIWNFIGRGRNKTLLCTCSIMPDGLPRRWMIDHKGSLIGINALKEFREINLLVH